MLDKIIIPHELISYFINNKDFHSSTGSFPDSTELKINRENVNELLNFLFRQKNYTGQDEENYRRISESAGRLMELIKKEYHLN